MIASRWLPGVQVEDYKFEALFRAERKAVNEPAQYRIPGKRKAAFMISMCSLGFLIDQFALHLI